MVVLRLNRKTLPLLLATGAIAVVVAAVFIISSQRGEEESARIAFVKGGLERGAMPEVYVANADGSGLTLLGEGHDPDPIWSLDGSRIAFTIDRRIDGRLVATEIWVANADGSGLSMLSEGWQPAWSPDGKRIAFSRGIGPEWHEPGLFVIDAGGADLVRLASSGIEPSWSPDSSRILFTQYVEGRGQIMTINADGSSLAKLADGQWPAWSPDGQRVAFAWTDSSAEARQVLWVIYADGSGLNRVATTEGRPLWSPDGRRLAVVSAVERGYEIEIFDVYKWERWYLADGTMPSWSPDGSRVAFVSARPDATYGQIFVVNADGSHPTQVSDFDIGSAGAAGSIIGEGGGPVWSPDGKHIAYVIEREDEQELFVVRADGSGLQRIAEGSFPVWAPTP
jgi:TolB protein